MSDFDSALENQGKTPEFTGTHPYVFVDMQTDKPIVIKSEKPEIDGSVTHKYELRWDKDLPEGFIVKLQRGDEPDLVTYFKVNKRIEDNNSDKKRILVARLTTIPEDIDQLQKKHLVIEPVLSELVPQVESA